MASKIKHEPDGAFALLDNENNYLLRVDDKALLFSSMMEVEEWQEMLDSNRTRYSVVEVKITATRKLA